MGGGEPGWGSAPGPYGSDPPPCKRYMCCKQRGWIRFRRARVHGDAELHRLHVSICPGPASAFHAAESSCRPRHVVCASWTTASRDLNDDSYDPPVGGRSVTAPRWATPNGSVAGRFHFGGGSDPSPPSETPMILPSRSSVCRARVQRMQRSNGVRA